MQVWWHVQEGLRMFRRSLQLRRRGFRRYKGNAEQICRAIVADCWNGCYFQVSKGNFPEFWTRDFGWCVDALLQLGWRKEVNATLAYALQRFTAAGRITTTINPAGRPFDFPNYAPDSLAWLLRSLRVAGASEIVRQHREFLESEVGKFVAVAVDAESGLIRPDRNFSSMKDLAKRRSACYDNVMAAVVKEEAGKLGLENPLRSFNYRKIVRDRFWNGNYFVDDLSGVEYVSGDANTFPFWTGLFTSAGMMRKAVAAMREEKLDVPLPLGYSIGKTRMRWMNLFAPGYEQDAVWLHMGPLFIEVVAKEDKGKAAAYVEQYRQLIERYGTYPEVLRRDGTPFSSPFYFCDEGMLWAANFLKLNGRV